MSSQPTAKEFRPLTRGAPPEDVARAREEIERMKREYGFLEPDRGDMDAPHIRWRNGRPDYTVANFAYMTGKSKNHLKGSLEVVVENLVKTWEMEATHIPFEQWTTVNQTKYTVQANGGNIYNGKESSAMGNYNWLLSGCPREIYDSENESFESSHEHFLKAFPHGFPWEVLEVYSGPPKVCFSWRHWAHFTGEYKGNRGNGEVVELTGFAVVLLDGMKVATLEIYYEPNVFLEVLQGLKGIKELKSTGAARGGAIAGGCPFSRS